MFAFSCSLLASSDSKCNTEYCSPIQNRGGTGKSRQNSSGTGIAKFAGAAPLITVQMTANTGVASVKGVPQAKVMSPWNRGTGMAQFS